MPFHGTLESSPQNRGPAACPSVVGHLSETAPRPQRQRADLQCQDSGGTRGMFRASEGHRPDTQHYPGQRWPQSLSVNLPAKQSRRPGGQAAQRGCPHCDSVSISSVTSDIHTGQSHTAQQKHHQPGSRGHRPWPQLCHPQLWNLGQPSTSPPQPPPQEPWRLRCVLGIRRETRVTSQSPLSQPPAPAPLAPSTRASSGVMVAHLTATLYFWVASAESMVT